MMVIYSSLDDVPLPPEIYNGPLDEKIVPLVKAIQPFGLTTIGSCQGHLDRFYPYPWVQLNPYENFKLLDYLVHKSNQRKDNFTPWYLQGNVLRTEREAKDILELIKLRDSVVPLANFLFQYRPEILDPGYHGNVSPIPPSDDPVYDKMHHAISRLLDELITIGKREIDHPDDTSFENSFREKIIKLQQLYAQEKAYVAQHGDTLIIPITNDQVGGWLKRAKELLD